MFNDDEPTNCSVHESHTNYDCVVRNTNSSNTLRRRILDVARANEWRGKLLILSMFGIQCIRCHIMFRFLFGIAASRQGLTNDGQRVDKVETIDRICESKCDQNCARSGDSNARRPLIFFTNLILLLSLLL